MPRFGRRLGAATAAQEAAPHGAEVGPEGQASCTLPCDMEMETVEYAGYVHA